MRVLLPEGRPLLVLAPMQDVTDLPFWNILHRYGGPDLYFTEYFRVHGSSRLEKHIVKAIVENPSGKPVMAQMIGEDIAELVRTARELQKLPIFGIDLNMGCPAPVVCRKSAGGGLLRRHGHVDEILRALRQEVGVAFTVKTRIGFERAEEFDALLEVFTRHPVDALSVHGRTVKEMYRSEVHLERIAQAVRAMPCPVFANGNIISPAGAQRAATVTGAAGLMIGRGCIRSPWLFTQIRERWAGGVETRPRLRGVLDYVRLLSEEVRRPGATGPHHVAAMKRYMNFIAQGVGGDDVFLQEVRRVRDEPEFWEVCGRHLDGEGEFPVEPEQGQLANAGNPRTDCYG